MNIAQRILAHYESPDFKNTYGEILAETFANDKADMVKRIFDLFNVSNYETEKYLSNWFFIRREQAEKIYEFIFDNFEAFTKDFSSYYVGCTSLDSVAFGEQEEQLTGIYNARTKKEYSLKYMQKVFEENDFYVNGKYAYYDMSSQGLHIDLLGNIELLNNFLPTIK